MGYASVRPARDTARIEHSRKGGELLFKPDHPRGIDRYIDYFGGWPEHAGADEVCGETILDRLG